MKTKGHLAVCFVAAVGLLILTSCSHKQSPVLANELAFSLKDISEVTISYDEEKVTFYESENDELIIKEYMTKSKSGYYAKINQSSDSIKISEGDKPFFKDGFSRYVEVYLPASYHESLTVTITDGDIDISELEMTLNALRIDSAAGAVKISTVAAQNIHLSTTSGVLEVNRLKADTIGVNTTSGSFSCYTLEGNVAYTTTSGNANIQSAIGSGSYKANNSGKLNVVYTEVTGDLSFYNKNDSIHVTLPADLEFEFQATTKNGFVSTNFQESISMDGRITSGTVGEQPTVTVKVETNNGDIEVRQ